jgi:hypothetical protein
LFLAPIATVTLGACGSPPPAAAPTPAAVAAPSQPVAAPADLSQVDEPKDLLVVARMNKPSESLKAVFGWAGMDAPQSEDVTELVAGERIGALVDLEQPIDFAVTMTMHGASPKPLGAISAAVKSMDDAKQVLSKYKLTPGSNGSFKIEGLGKVAGDADDDGGGDDRSCALVPAFGAATTRIVCGDSDASLEALTPYLARTMPRTTFPSDVHVEVRLAPVQPFVEKQKKLLPIFLGPMLGMHKSGNSGIDDAVKAGFGDLADLALDANKISLDAMVADAQGTLTMTAGFRSSTSLLARLAVAHPERAAAPPAAFWKLPGDADFTFFNGGIDATDFASPRDHLVAMVGSGLQKDGLGDADRKPLVDAATHTLDLFSSPIVFGKGVDVAAAEKALAAVRATKDDGAKEEAERVAAEAVAGWTLLGVEQPAAKVVSVAKEWPAAWSRAGVQKWLKTQVDGAAPPSIANAPMPKTLPKEGAHLAITVHRPHHADPKNKKAKAPSTKPMVLHLLVVPDGTRTWLAFAADEALAEAKIKEVLGGQPLAQKPGLASMHDARMNAGGFASVRGVIEGITFGWALAPRWSALHHDVFDGLASGPDGGATPIPFTFAARAGQGDDKAGQFVTQVTIPKSAIADIVKVALGGH